MNFISMKQSIENGMNRSASFYSFFAGLLGFGYINQSIGKSIKDRQASSIEVLGAGDGTGLKEICSQFETVRLIDLSPNMLARAKNHLADDKIEFVQGDESSIGKGQLVFLPFVFNMYSQEDHQKLLKCLDLNMTYGQELLILDFNPAKKSGLFRTYLWILYKGFRILTGIPVSRLCDYHSNAKGYFEFLDERTYANSCLSARLYGKKKAE